MVANKPDSPVAADEKKPEVKKVDETWKDKPNAVITRVFRQVNWYKTPSKKMLCIANLPKRQVNGTDFNALSVILEPNSACQYVLYETQEGYAECLKGLRRHEAKGFIIEIDPSELGKMGIPPYEPTEIEKENAKLKAEIDALKAKMDADKSGSGLKLTKEEK